ncbi:MerR family transcriptional regulator [Chloroflexota bacterium]
MNPKSKTDPKPTPMYFVTDVARALGVTDSVIRYWMRSGIVGGKKITLPTHLRQDDLFELGVYYAPNPDRGWWSTRPVRWVTWEREVRWLFGLKEDFPLMFEERPRGWLRFEKAQYEKFMKGDDTNE